VAPAEFRADERKFLAVKVKDPDSDLSNLDDEKLTIAAQLSAKQYHEANPRKYDTQDYGLAVKILACHNLLGNQLLTFKVAWFDYISSISK
jgi:hypothetical protein